DLARAQAEEIRARQRQTAERQPQGQETAARQDAEQETAQRQTTVIEEAARTNPSEVQQSTETANDLSARQLTPLDGNNAQQRRETVERRFGQAQQGNEGNLFFNENIRSAYLDACRRFVNGLGAPSNETSAARLERHLREFFQTAEIRDSLTEQQRQI